MTESKSKITALIVDDEAHSRNVLKKLLESEKEVLEVIDEASDVEEAYLKIQKLEPQLVFLDIQMPKSNGFNLLKKFQKLPFEVIFVTSYDKYAINAIKFSALDYLLKPIEYHDLHQAVNKAVVAIQDKVNNNLLVVNLLHALDDDVHEKKVAVHSSNKVKMISGLNILYIEGDRRYCHLYTTDGEKFVTAKYLGDFEDYFEEDSSFIRINRGYLINAKHIKQYTKGEPFIIEMVNGQTFEVARRKKSEVLNKLKK